MKVKEIDRTVNIAWSPASHHPIMLAAGTAAQQLDASFSTSAALELYSLNLSEPGLDMELRTSASSDFRFHKLAWSSYGPSRDRENGLIVGGCDGGRVQIYSASKLLHGEEGLVARQDKHTGPVRALDFNPYQPNLLASGASDSEIFIWDMNNIETPMLPGAKSQPAEDVLWISWNKQVQHILASTFAQRCVVWDLRKNEPIIKLTDSTSRVRWKVIAWHPEVATQLCLASEEDQTPVIQLWDLRFATSPLKVFDKHQRGVSSIAWCPQDSDLLVSCGKDNRILCWNPNSNIPGGEVICDITTTHQWHFDVTWCPRNPVLIATSSYDGHVSVYSLMGGQQQVQTTNKIADSFPGMETYAQAPPQQQQQVAVELLKAPKWLKRRCGASFGFGGKLITFCNESPSAAAGGSGQTGEPYIPRTVHISQVVTDSEFITRSGQLEQALNNNLFMDFCQLKIISAQSTHEQSIWKFLKANFSSNPRGELLQLLGFQSEEVASKISKFLDKPANAKSEDGVDGLTNQMANLGRQNDAAADFRSTEQQRSSPVGTNTEASAAFDAIAATSYLNGTSKFDVEPYKISIANDADGLISQALLVGNIEAAVDICLEEERYADAIILAMTGGTELLANTQYRYLKKSKGFLKNIINSIVMEDWSHVIKTCSVDSWKEALAGVLTYTKNEEFVALSEILGERLETEADGKLSANAQLCYICAGNLSKLVENWVSLAQTSDTAKLQELVELTMLLQKAIGLQGRASYVTGKLAGLLSQYAGILASQGQLDAALSYLNESQDAEIEALRERLLCALGHKQAYPQARQQYGSVKPQHVPSAQQNGVRTSESSYARQPQYPQMPANTHSQGFQNQPGLPQAGFAPPQPSAMKPPVSNIPSQTFAPPPPSSQQFIQRPPPSETPTSFLQPVTSQPYIQKPPPQQFNPPPQTFPGSAQTFPGQVPPQQSGQSQQPFSQIPASSQSFSSSSVSQPFQQTPLSSNSQPFNQVPSSVHQSSISSVPPVNAPPGMPPSSQPSGFPTQPTPPPPSVTPVQSSGSQRAKYVLDPSVQSSPAGNMPVSNFGRGPYDNRNQTSSYDNRNQTGSYDNRNQTTSYDNRNQTSSFPMDTGSVRTYPVGAGSTELYNPADTLSSNPPSNPNVALNYPTHSASSGWNDPPMVKNSPKNQPPKQEQMSANPITHPLFGSAPASGPAINNLPGQTPGSFPGQTPGPFPGQTSGPFPGQTSGPFPGQTASPFPGQTPGPFPGQTPGFQGVGVMPSEQYPTPDMQSNSNYGGLPQNYNQFQNFQSQNVPPRQMTPPVRIAEPEKPKSPLPEEYMYLQTVFDELRNRCSCAASNPQTKRKLEDVARRLEVLYDSLRESKLSQSTLQGLHQLVQMVQIGDYQGALGLHTQLVSSPDFSSISSFMPGLKVLLQCALQLQVYLQ